MSFDPNSLPVPDLGIKCLTCGYPLAGLPSHRCPECGVEFAMEDHIPKGDFPPLIFNAKEVIATLENLDLFKQARIPVIELARAGDMLYGIGGATYTGPHLGVARMMYFDAIDLLRRHQLGELANPDDASTTSPDKPDWTCSACDEENPGTFDICWNCGK